MRKQLFWELHKKCQLSDTIELWGTGAESRDFIYVGDLVRVFDIIIHQAPFVGEQINVANGTEVTIETAVQTFLKQYDKKIGYKFNGQVKPGDPLNWVADISQIKVTLR